MDREEKIKLYNRFFGAVTLAKVKLYNDIEDNPSDQKQKGWSYELMKDWDNALEQLYTILCEPKIEAERQNESQS